MYSPREIVSSKELLSQLPLEFQYKELKAYELQAERLKAAKSRGKFILFLINLGMLGAVVSPQLNNWAEKNTRLSTIFPQTAPSFIETELEVPDSPQANSIKDRMAIAIINHAKQRKWIIRTGAKKYNIFYVRGINPDGKLNGDKQNHFNDLRILIEIIGDRPRIVEWWNATADPGDYYIRKPMNPQGTAFIAEGQYRAWQVGYHKGRVLALVQTGGAVTVRRRGIPYTGYFGINQHSGYDYAVNNVYDASAACLAGRTKKGHAKFMRYILQDADYVKNNSYILPTGIISGKDLKL
ncbi:MAG: hypothetical protein WBB28_20885 [Crinalium sp.]